MLYLLQTIGLLAAAGIMLPVIIHLWNKKKGKTLRVGSVKLLVETALQQARSLRLKELLLLLLRCAVIIFLAVLLAKPVWQKQLVTKDKKGWIVLEETGQAYNHYKRSIDSLIQAGFEVHRFTTGFPIIKPEDIAQSIRTDDTLMYWPLLKALNEQVPDDLPVYLFTGNRLAAFTGSRPGVKMNLHWLTFANSDTATGNTIAVRLMANDSLETIVANSTAANTTYEKRRQNALAFTGNDSILLKADTSTLQVGILKDPSGNDAAYLEAAIRAIQQFGQYRMQLTSASDPNSLTGNYDWIFWLSEKDPPATLKSKNIFRYEKGKEKTAATWVENLPGNERIQLSKSIMGGTLIHGQIIWANGFGEPVLTGEKGTRNVYHFYSRFNPAWTGLVWHEAFPQLLFNLLQKKKKNENEKDNRAIDAQQIQPAIAKAGMESRKPAFIETTDLTKWAWVAAFLLFALERIIVFKTKKEAYARP